MEAFSTLWELAEEAKLRLGSLAADGSPPARAFTPDPVRVLQALRQAGVVPAGTDPDPAQLAVTLEAAQFERAARPVVEEITGIIRGLLDCRLPPADRAGGKIDWLI